MREELGFFAKSVYLQKYSMDQKEEWPDTARRVVENVMGPYLPELVDKTVALIEDRKFLPGGRYLYAAGREVHQVQNCLLLKVDDSKESIGDLYQRTAISLMTGAGIGVVWSNLRPEGAKVRGMGGKSTGPLAFMYALNEQGRGIMQGGSRRSAIWAGLHWHHPDAFKFATMKNWSDEIKSMKEKNFNAVAPMDMTNISIILDDDFFAAMEDPDYTFDEWNKWSELGIVRDETPHAWANRIYWTVVEQMLTTAEPGFSVDVGENAGEHLRNACTEVTSRDDNDICNLGSLNLARIESKGEFSEAVELATAFLLCGTLYSTVPYERVADTRTKNRRLGLGLMGVHEWLLTRGYAYGPNEELGTWLSQYARSTEIAAEYADRLGISRPVKTRAMAPNGTIGIIGETTTSIEPILAAAIKRRYLKGNEWHYQLVVDQSAKRLIDKGVDPALIEDAYDLANEPERRIAFQAWFQQFVDHGISSTINLPSPDQRTFTDKDFGVTLYRYLPQLRGITVYPDGARGGQPITKVDLEFAMLGEGTEFAENGNESACIGGACGV